MTRGLLAGLNVGLLLELMGADLCVAVLGFDRPCVPWGAVDLRLLPRDRVLGLVLECFFTGIIEWMG